MKSNLTELVFILDRSGSMGGLEHETITGYNRLLSKQKEEIGEAVITTVLFDDKIELLHERKNALKILQLTEKDYYVRGSTALLDALGSTIDNLGVALANTNESERPSKVLFVIITDGMENASLKYTAEKVKGMIEQQKSVYSWEFMFLGANIDAVATAKSYGISETMAANFVCDEESMEMNFEAMEKVVSCVRSSQSISPQWKKEISENYERKQKI